MFIHEIPIVYRRDTRRNLDLTAFLDQRLCNVFRAGSYVPRYGNQYRDSIRAGQLLVCTNYKSFVDSGATLFHHRFANPVPRLANRFSAAVFSAWRVSCESASGIPLLAAKFHLCLVSYIDHFRLDPEVFANPFNTRSYRGAKIRARFIPHRREKCGSIEIERDLIRTSSTKQYRSTGNLENAFDRGHDINLLFGGSLPERQKRVNKNRTYRRRSLSWFVGFNPTNDD